MAEVRGVVVSANQFNGYNPPVYKVKPGERVLSAKLRRESGNQLTLYLAVADSGPGSGVSRRRDTSA